MPTPPSHSPAQPVAISRPERSPASAAQPAKPARAFILSEDPDLAGTLAGDERSRAAELLHAETFDVGRPRWEPPSPDGAGAYGLLVLEGLLARQIRVGRAMATELLGPGDIVRPWDKPLSSHVIPPQHEWIVLHTSRVAVLDRRITELLGNWPELSASFAARLVRHSRSLAYLMAISNLTRVDDRLLGLLWHLASMWGRVTPTGVTVPFRLTHQVLGEVIGAQRPSVTTAMRSLEQRDVLQRGEHGGFVLRGGPPEWSQGQNGT